MSKVTKEMILVAHDVVMEKGDLILSAALLERIYLAMDKIAPKSPCQTCESLARAVMADQMGHS